MTDDDPLLAYPEAAAVAGVSVRTLRNYKAAGTLPEPDDDTFPDRPRWHRSTITAWLAARPGQGVGGGRPPGRSSG
ncbi:MarR family transcriptional regulator [Pseudofrankia sp. BMG5.37]|uniref:helix-turn-helix transcriptional regulator n=1 Tax=Pseudofrankia sp. BMG5.37 TaxID=3050035 RepID=UPI0028940FC1|nr:MarR family transcriptional regulator [Pseudofrankia sp. BMG5.37]MDT3438323.1 MarR family transcriptional regulator [Pseudofrankia sp. BMG5.37]